MKRDCVVFDTIEGVFAVMRRPDGARRTYPVWGTRLSEPSLLPGITHACVEWRLQNRFARVSASEVHLGEQPLKTIVGFSTGSKRLLNRKEEGLPLFLRERRVYAARVRRG